MHWLRPDWLPGNTRQPQWKLFFPLFSFFLGGGGTFSFTEEFERQAGQREGSNMQLRCSAGIEAAMLQLCDVQLSFSEQGAPAVYPP